MALGNKRATLEELYHQLVEIPEGDFSRVRDAFDKRMVGFVYGREMDELLTGDLHSQRLLAWNPQRR